MPRPPIPERLPDAWHDNKIRGGVYVTAFGRAIVKTLELPERTTGLGEEGVARVNGRVASGLEA